jgi:ribonuclease P protein component
MPRDARVEGFSRRHRFTVQGSFSAVLRNSRKLRSPHAILHVSPSGMNASSRLGVAVTRRLIPSSVERNRIKRSIREAFRRHPIKRAGLDLVVTFRSRILPGEVSSVVAEVKALLDDACGAHA